MNLSLHIDEGDCAVGQHGRRQLAVPGFGLGQFDQHRVGHGLGLGLDRRSLGLTTHADGIGLGKPAQADRIGFRFGPGEDDESLYLSSADWMSRNMQRRIEVAWPVNDPRLRQRVIDECLVPYLHDACDAWEQHSDGSYHRVRSDGPSAQAALAARYMTASSPTTA